jgi:hypothetical protein
MTLGRPAAGALAPFVERLWASGPAAEATETFRLVEPGGRIDHSLEAVEPEEPRQRDTAMQSEAPDVD